MQIKRRNSVASSNRSIKNTSIEQKDMKNDGIGKRVITLNAGWQSAGAPPFSPPKSPGGPLGPAR